MISSVFTGPFVFLAVNLYLASCARPLDVSIVKFDPEYKPNRTIIRDIPMEEPLMKRHKRQVKGHWISDDYMPFIYPLKPRYKPISMGHGAEISANIMKDYFKSMILGRGVKQPNKAVRIHVKDRPNNKG